MTAAQPDAPPPREGRAPLLIAIGALVAIAALTAWVALQPRTTIAGEPQWSAIAPPLTTPLNPWRWIVIHHSATPGGSAAGIDRTHHDINGWDGIGYHFIIGNGNPLAIGAVEATFRWRGQGAGAHAGANPQAAPYNRFGIGICLIGDYQQHPPETAQLQRTAELCALLVHQFPSLSIDRIIGHGAVPGKKTDCPGLVSVEHLRFLTRSVMERHGWIPR